ncbi:uL15 family ribosomal protein [Candidatus Pacearchaeota archaeon]|nr:uL15 family ribosomal protein [Candidatus Pacearchaeota archaeon]
MRIKRRRKASRYRGSHTHGRGFKKKARGSGHQGGKGMAGTGKRGDAKKTLILNLYGNDYFKRDKALRRGRAVPKLEAINLGSIAKQLHSFIKQGKAKESKGMHEVNLKGYKVLGEGDIHQKLHITADAASKSAIDKVKKAGGEIILKSSPAG